MYTASSFILLTTCFSHFLNRGGDTSFEIRNDRDYILTERLQFNELDTKATEIDPISDLDVDRSFWSPSLALTFKMLPSLSYYLSYGQSVRSGTAVLESPLIFNETSFTSGESVKTTIIQREFVSGAQITALNVDIMDIDLTAKLHYDTNKISLSTVQRGTDSDRLNVIYPMLGVSMEVPFTEDILSMFRIEGTSFRLGFESVTRYSMEASIQYQLSRLFIIEAGVYGLFKRLVLDHSEDNNARKVKEFGTYLSLTISL